MNPTIVKFGHPQTLIREFGHWLVVLRPAQVTLGSVVLAAKGDATAFAALPAAAFAELHDSVAAIERGLGAFRPFDRINYLMLMMVDPHVHFHVIPRFSGPQSWAGVEFADAGWPGPPQLGAATSLTPAQIEALASELRKHFD